MATTATISAVKTSLRITVSTAFDAEIGNLIDASLIDLGFGGVANTDVTDPIILRAVTTYCRVNFGSPDDYDRLKASYDEQKAQLGTATGYTNWGA